MNWRLRALCATRPADWWDLGDDGNRLALALCSVCPVLDRCAGSREFGVVRGGVAWSDAGVRLPLCPCGRPAGRPSREMCFTCWPSEGTAVPGRLRVRQRRGSVDEHFGQITAWRAEGVTFAEIAYRLRMRKDTVRKAWRGRCPQAVSTEEDAA